jgi:hypothetical protein
MDEHWAEDINSLIKKETALGVSTWMVQRKQPDWLPVGRGREAKEQGPSRVELRWWLRRATNWGKEIDLGARM